MVLLCLAALLAPLLATNEHSATTLSDHRLATSIATDVVASFELDTFASGLFIPTDIAFTSSGVAFVTEKHGMLKVIQNGTTSVFADLRTRVNDDGDRGCNLRSEHICRHVHVAHQRHGLETAQRVDWYCPVHR